MKKIISLMTVLFLVLMIMAPGVPVRADERSLDSFTVDVPTYAVTEVARTAAHIDGVIFIHKITVSNNDVAYGQQVSFYELGDATTTVNLKYRVYSGSQAAPLQDDWNIPASPWEIEDLLIRKSLTGSSVQVTVWYR